jgi:MutS domain V
MLETLKTQYQDYIQALQEEFFGTTKPSSSKMEDHFRLPISYIEPSEIHELSPVLSADLELATSENKSMYESIFQPKHDLAKRVLLLWNQQYTSNTAYLEDSQAILKQMGRYKKIQEQNINYDEVALLWKNIKTNPNFLDTYGYIEWNSLRYLNQSDSFLEVLSMANLCSPLLSLSIPFFIFFFPFIILKLQGVSITFDAYMDVLKTIARHHFIGKALSSLSELTLERIVYIVFSFGLYALQVYQNTTSCLRFYKNIKYINESLVILQEFVNTSIWNMETYVEIAQPCESHRAFLSVLEFQCAKMRTLREQLARITKFSSTFGKLGEVGYMLKCFYELYTNSEYESAIYFSMGFEGYRNNLQGVFENISSGSINYASFATGSQSTILKKQYYPAWAADQDGKEKPVKNDVSMEKNIILSAPNKAGKTTLLKTTAINIIFTQQFGCGCYDSCTLVPYTHIHSYLNIPDTSGRDSLFQAESRRCKEILDKIKNNGANAHHFCMFDELFSGTNPEEATKAGYAFLKYLSTYKNVDFMLTTHYLSICKKFQGSENVVNCKMRVQVLPDGTFVYTYKMKPGISAIKGAIRVLKDMDYPTEIVSMLSG